jgi:hypothetical protein
MCESSSTAVGVAAEMNARRSETLTLISSGTRFEDEHDVEEVHDPQS